MTWKWVKKPRSAAIVFFIASAFVSFFPALSYAAVSYSFNNASATGTVGPTQAQVNSAYSGGSLAGLVTINTQGVQEWLVPSTGQYKIDIAGAKGGNGVYGTGGGGAVLSFNVNLTANERYAIIVGQMGATATGGSSAYNGGSGGGGSFIYRMSDNYLVAAAGGGGGGSGNNTNSNSSQTNANGKADTTTGTSIVIGAFRAAGGVGGQGGQSSNRNDCSGGLAGCNSAGSGAGFLSAGATASGMQGLSRTGNWVGGTRTSPCTAGDGGFGGGGAVGSIVGVGGSSECWAGGGGGYSGGASGGNGGNSDSQYGGGGGSYYVGSLLSSTNGGNTGHGYVTLTLNNATPTLSVSTSTSNLSYRAVRSISATPSVAGKLTFKANNLIIPGCKNLLASANVAKTCNYKPFTRGNTVISVTIVPTDVAYTTVTTQASSFTVTPRSGAR